MTSSAARRERVRSTDWALYFITDTPLAGGRENVPRQVRAAIEGGAHVIQVRDKTASDDEFRALALSVIAAVGEMGEEIGRSIPVIVNDRVQIAAELGCDVHVGQEDLAGPSGSTGSAAAVRALVGESALVGVSASTAEELEAIIADGTADIVGLGPVWDTATKPDAQAPLGIEGLRPLVARAHEAGLTAVAIGGITARTAAHAAVTGVDGICVISAIAGAEDPALAATFIRREFVMNQPWE